MYDAVTAVRVHFSSSHAKRRRSSRFGWESLSAGSGCSGCRDRVPQKDLRVSPERVIIYCCGLNKGVYLDEIKIQ